MVSLHSPTHSSQTHSRRAGNELFRMTGFRKPPGHPIGDVDSLAFGSTARLHRTLSVAWGSPPALAAETPCDAVNHPRSRSAGHALDLPPASKGAHPFTPLWIPYL